MIFKRKRAQQMLCINNFRAEKTWEVGVTYALERQPDRITIATKRSNSFSGIHIDTWNRVFLNRYFIDPSKFTEKELVYIKMSGRVPKKYRMAS